MGAALFGGGGGGGGDAVSAGLDYVNNAPAAALREDLMRVCHSATWASTMIEARPFASVADLKRYAADFWMAVDEADWLEGFRGHPRIGDVDALRKKFAAAKATGAKVWESGEQSGADGAAEETLVALRQANVDYEAKFGFIFLVCASGKTAEEMLAILQSRFPNPRDEEIVVAAGEQNKITMLRLDKLLAEHGG